MNGYILTIYNCTVLLPLVVKGKILSLCILQEQSTTHGAWLSTEVVARLEEYTHLYGLW